jgi:hypothetical protein
MRRILMAVAVTALGAVGLVAAVAGHDSRTPTPERPAAGSHARFVALSERHTNRCDLQASEIRSYASTERLQGSCCNAMDEAAYRRQVRYLRRYAHTADIPRDPYDVSAGLTQRLLGYDHAVKLTAAQQATYREAMTMSREKGPCCCRCWRWTAFRGLSKQLIARRRMGASELARLIEALDGCGGDAA